MPTPSQSYPRVVANRFSRFLAISATTLLVTGSGTAFAAVSVGSTTKCTITAKAPTLNATKQLTGSATVTCNKSAAILIDVIVVEMDGTAEDPTNLGVKLLQLSTSVTANVAKTISTNTATCISTETGNEEYATKARVSLSGLVSTYDRTVPANDSYAC